MYRLSGIKVLAKERDEHRGWDPRFGVWEPQLERVNEQRSGSAPSLLPEIDGEPSVALPPIRVFWRGPGTLGDSLGNVNLESLSALLDLGFSERIRLGLLSSWNPRPELASDARFEAIARLRSEAYPEADLEVQVPGVAEAVAQRCLRFFFHEFGYFYRFPIRPQDVLWAPSFWTAERLRRAFPKNPTIVSPHGVNAEIFSPAPSASTTKRPFRFLYVGTTISRKGIDLLLKAFALERAALPDAELVLKVFPTTAGFVWPEIYRQGEDVRVIDSACSAAQMASLYREADVLVAPSRAEGFGLPVLEAMACGLPAILPTGSSMQEFCPEEVSFPVESDVVEVPVPGQQISFLEPDLGSLRGAMHRAYAERERLRGMGERAAALARRYSWKAVTKLALARGWGSFSAAP